MANKARPLRNNLLSVGFIVDLQELSDTHAVEDGGPADNLGRLTRRLDRRLWLGFALAALLGWVGSVLGGWLGLAVGVSGGWLFGILLMVHALHATGRTKVQAEVETETETEGEK